MGVADERLHVADAVSREPGAEHVGGDERLQRGVAARRTTLDGDTVGVDEASLAQVTHRRDDILDVGHAPLAAQRVAVGPPESGGSAVVHIRDGEAA